MAITLAPVYLDDNRIRLQGDPRPKVRRILEAGGKKAEGVEVMQLKSQTDDDGKILRPEDVIDRTQHVDVAVYLRVVPKHGQSGGMSSEASHTSERQKRAEGKAKRSEDAESGQGDVPEGYGGHEQQGVQQSGGGGGAAREFGRQDTDVEETERGLGERTGGQPITGMGQKQQSGRERMAEPQEWKPGVAGTGGEAGRRHGGTAPGALGKSDDSTGQFQRQFSGGKADIRTQQTGAEGGASESNLEAGKEPGRQGTDSEGAASKRGPRPKRQDLESSPDPELP